MGKPSRSCMLCTKTSLRTVIDLTLLTHRCSCRQPRPSSKPHVPSVFLPAGRLDCWSCRTAGAWLCHTLVHMQLSAHLLAPAKQAVVACCQGVRWGSAACNASAQVSMPSVLFHTCCIHLGGVPVRVLHGCCSRACRLQTEVVVTCRSTNKQLQRRHPPQVSVCDPKAVIYRQPSCHVAYAASVCMPI